MLAYLEKNENKLLDIDQLIRFAYFVYECRNDVQN